MAYNYRSLVRVILEAETPIVIGCGEKESLTDAPVQKDVNRLPYLPASSIAGCLRHAVAKCIDKKTDERIFGFQESGKGNGSRLIFTDGRLVGPEGVVDGIKNDLNTDFFREFDRLPVRDHVRISEKGSASQGGKFDEEIVYKGSRFCFEIEMVSDRANESNDSKCLEKVLNRMTRCEFRIGAGSRSGFGKVKVVELKTRKFDLANAADMAEYLKKSSDLSDPVNFWTSVESKIPAIVVGADWTAYKLQLVPQDFFLFASGVASDRVDMCNVTDSRIEWKGEKPEFCKDQILIPGSSVKGAISHRVAFYYNKLTGVTVEKLAEDAKASGKNLEDLIAENTGDKNEAVRTLFGSQDPKSPCHGNVLISDVIQEKSETKVLNHVAVDRFTGGAVNGALFSEEPWAKKNGQKYEIDFLVNNDAFQNANIQEAFESALKAVASGMLPLGGGVNRGHGVFVGTVIKNGEVLR